jgi:hypothetical protein
MKQRGAEKAEGDNLVAAEQSILATKKQHNRNQTKNENTTNKKLYNYGKGKI